jgi:TPR repeat protein
LLVVLLVASIDVGAQKLPEDWPREYFARGWTAMRRNDYVQAMNWFQMAAAYDFAPAQGSIGWLYRNGQGVTRDYAEAMRWFRKAADKGDAGSEEGIGWLYRAGQGVPSDYAEAMQWFRMAADKGSAGGEAHG